MYHIIGSGPASIACAKALLDAGKDVTMIDCGNELEENKKILLENLKYSNNNFNYKDWNALYDDNFIPTRSGFTQKSTYGSYFPYKDTDLHIPKINELTGPASTLALGGFSNNWGAAIMPYNELDLKGWPLELRDLNHHYFEIAKMIGVSSCTDNLSLIHNSYSHNEHHLDSSNQAKEVLKITERNKYKLISKGIYVGKSRLAIKDSGKNCIYCGYCLKGCPKEIIYNSAYTLLELLLNKKFKYIRGKIVNYIKEKTNITTIYGFDKLTNTKFEIESEKVFLGAGVISTSKIILWSKNLFDYEVKIKDSQLFHVPIFLPPNINDPSKEQIHTLSQLFIELYDISKNNHTIHLQMYTYNKLWKETIDNTFIIKNNITNLVSDKLSKRLGILFGYLHSDDSSYLTIKLKKQKANELTPHLDINEVINPATKIKIKEITKRLLKEYKNLGFITIPPMTKILDVGKGHHVGGSFPMSSITQGESTDILGRPEGFKNLHIIDASNFPTIPATTITFSVMANAHRIGYYASRL
jgi:choline dehydrogenase-like flavoprotein